MSSYIIATICSHSAAIPAILGVIRQHQDMRTYRPFFIFLLLGWLNEIVSTIVIHYGMSNAVNSNIYVLAEFLCILLLFRNWGTSPKRFTVYRIVAIMITSFWIADNIVVNSITETNAVYRLCYSLVLVFFSVDQINHVVFMERTEILRNSKFIICSGFLLFFTFKALMESFYVFELGLSIKFHQRFMMVMVIVNVLVNLIYSIAILWMPRKQNFSLHY